MHETMKHMLHVLQLDDPIASWKRLVTSCYSPIHTNRWALVSHNSKLLLLQQPHILLMMSQRAADTP